MLKLRKPNEARKLTGDLISSGRDLCRRARRGDFPPGVIVYIGGRVYFDEDKLLAFLVGGGGKPGAFKQRGADAGSAPQAAPCASE